MHVPLNAIANVRCRWSVWVPILGVYAHPVSRPRLAQHPSFTTFVPGRDGEVECRELGVTG